MLLKHIPSPFYHEVFVTSKKLGGLSDIPEGSVVRIEITLREGNDLEVHYHPESEAAAVAVMALAIDLLGYDVNPVERGEPSNTFDDIETFSSVYEIPVAAEVPPTLASWYNIMALS